jgi:hypothetical protein
MFEERIKSTVSSSVAYNGDRARDAHLTFTAAVLNPVFQALAAGVLFGVIFGIIFLSLRIGLIAGSLAAFVGYVISLYIWWLIRLAYDAHMGLNIKSKRKVRAELIVTFPGERGGVRREAFPVTQEQMLAFARGVVLHNVPTAEAYWCVGDNRVFSRPEFVRLRTFLVDKGLAFLKSQDAARGWGFTRSGYKIMAAIAEGRYVTGEQGASAERPTLPRRGYDGLEPVDRSIIEHVKRGGR